MTVCRNGIACRCQFYVDSSLCHNAFATFQSAGDFHTVTVSASQGYFLFLVAGLVQLDIDKVEALLLGNGTDRQTDDILPFVRQQVNFGKGTRNNVSAVGKFEGYRNIISGIVGSLTILKQSAVQLFQAESFLTVRRLEVG